MVVYIITIHIHLYIHWIYDLERVLHLILSLLYYFTQLHEYIKKNEEKFVISIYYQIDFNLTDEYL